MVREVAALLAVRPGMTVVDATVGLGGHAAAILERMGDDGLYVGLDRDADALREAAARLAGQAIRCRFLHANFAEMDTAVRAAGVDAADAVLMDLGVSSMQLDHAERGFGFMQDGPLDMRMDQGCGMTAAQWIAAADAEELETVFRTYGEERQARRVARAIVRERTQGPIRTTTDLARVVAAAKGGRRGRTHPATQVFQAVRMQVNGEYEALQAGLAAGLDLLRVGGRMAVIAFHSIEDRAVKTFMRRHAGRWEALPAGGEAWRGTLPRVRPLRRRVLRPSPDETTINPRARSAKLRAWEREGD
jgi:16S rRNA (cytosine1402-N4)-methyltransferase